MQEGLVKMRARVRQGRFNGAEHKKAMAAEEKGRNTLERIRKESGMSDEFVALMRKAILSKLND